MPTLPNINPQIVKAYEDEIKKSSSPATAKRKMISLNKFFNWAGQNGHMDTNPLTPNTDDVVAIKPKKKRSPVVAIAILGMTFGIAVMIFALTSKLSLPIPFTFTPAKEGVPESNLQANLPVATSAPKTATTAENGDWKLFANLKLAQPQVLSFKLYKSATDTSPVWESQPTEIKPDSEGSNLISLDGIPTELFFGNNTLSLGIEANGSEIVDRIPVSTANTPVIDTQGNLVLTGQSPTVNDDHSLIEADAITIKTTDGGDGNIEINPDGKGIAHFLFEGTGQNFLNAQAPNLTSGSLYYGIVANNAVGYDLIRLQNGTTPKTRFSVDALGNTFIDGKLTVDDNINITNGGLQIAGVTRLTNLGRLASITGYYQDSGLFQIDQGVPDYAKIQKVLSTATGASTADVLTLTLDESTLPTGSDSSTLVLNRSGEATGGFALLVDEGNARFDGQIQLGRFSSNPTAIGSGSVYYNTTDDQIYYYDGSAWQSLGTAITSPFANISSGTNTTAAMVVGSGASLSTSGTGTISATDLTCTGCVANSELANSTITFAGDTGSSATSLGGTRTIAGGTGIDTSESAGTLTVAVQDDSLDFAQFADSMTLDANTDIATAGFTLSTSGIGALNFASTGQVTFAGNVDFSSGIDVTGGISGDGTNVTNVDAVTLDGLDSTQFLRSDTSDSFTSGTLTFDAGTTVDINGDISIADTNIAFDGATTTFTTTGDLTLSIGGGDLILNDTNTINIGGSGSDVAYNVIGDSTVGASVNVDSDDDLYIEGNLEVDGTIYGNVSGTINPGFTTGSVIFQGASGLSQDNTNFFWDDSTNSLGIGDNTPTATLTVGSGDLFQVAGASGNITTAGDLALNGGDITSTGSLALTPTTTLTLNSTGDLTLDSSTDIILDADGADLIFKDAGTTIATFTNSTTDVTLDIAGGNLFLADGDTINIGGLTGSLGYNSIANAVDAPDEGAISSDNDLYVGGDVEIDGTLYAASVTATAMAWSGLTDPSANLSLSMNEYTTVFNWNTAATAAGFDGMTYSITNDAGVDATTQRLLVLTNNDDAGATGTTETLLVLNNADANEAVTTGLSITDTGGGGFTTDISLQNSETIDNATDGVIAITAGSTTFSGDITVTGNDITFGNGETISNAVDGTIAITATTTQTSGNLDVNGTSNDIAGTLNLSGDTLTSSTDLTIDATGGGVKIGTGTPGTVDLVGDDLYVTGDLEVDGILYGVGSGLTSVNADTLDTLDSLQFLRSDTSDSFTSGTLTFDAGTTVDVNGDIAIADTNIAFVV